ncbi:aspartate/glutamate racemase family protein [Sporosarcina cyprini]|uniref:aspartate/glutamate racemase family protein n=1 Tax=Sporosarcina cyprini TaxID=2910523 RepID=UPI001EE0C782|nr:aspartate/glutamate racemase family protein [Sporosarcina cyprini]MCG3088250.1 aspartate/glutamate racemase family protein [Sporosarcina cyprini]
MLGIIRVLTTDNQDVLLEHGKRMWDTHEVETVTKCIDDQPNGIYDSESEQLAIPKIVALAKELMQQEGIDAVTISCAADPGLEEVRRLTDFTVLGAGACGATAACLAGEHVAVIGITDKIPLNIEKELQDKFHSYTYSPALRKTTDLFSTDAQETLLALAQEAIAAGADVILFACTGFSTIKLKDYLVEHIAIPVIDLVEAQAMVYELVRREEKG